MIKENKKNKLVTFLCACLMVCASALGLVQAVGTTLAYTPTAYTTAEINEYFTNYGNYDYTTLFDLTYINVNNTVNTTSFFVNLQIRDFNGNTNGTLIPNTTVTNDGSNIALYYDNSTWTTGVESYSSSVSSIYISGFTKAVYFTGLTGLINFLKADYSYLGVLVNGNWYNLISGTAFDRNKAYKQGLADADTTSAYNNGYNTGYSEGQTAGYNTGYSEGQTNGYNTGYSEGQTAGYNSGVTQGQNNVVNNPNDYNLYTEEQYQQNYLNGQNSVLNNPNAYGLYTVTQYNDNYTAGYFAGNENGYENGYVDGKDDGIEIGYQQGLNSNTAYDEGKQFVVDNPSLFDLYTEADMEQRYLEGFNDGLRTSREGILYNSNVTGGIVYRDSNSDSGYSALNISQYIVNSNGVYTLSNGFYDAYNDIVSNYTISEVAFSIDGGLIDVSTSRGLGFIMTDKTLINVITTTGIDRTTTFNVKYYVYDDIDVINDYDVVYRIIPIIEDNLIVNYELDYDIPTELLNKRVHTISFRFADNLGNIPLSLLTNFSLSDINNLAYNAGYDNGYNDAMNSNIVDNAYDRGYTDGNRVGYQQGLSNGLANSNDYTFFGLIGAVIDAPIQYLSSLFNFDILGFNLLAFITSLFTVCVIIWIVKMLLGGK